MKPPRPIEDRIHACQNCDRTVAEDRFCEGCGAFICEACDTKPVTSFEHEPLDHGDSGYRAEIYDINAEDDFDSL